jgi:hypothetical protein
MFLVECPKRGDGQNLDGSHLLELLPKCDCQGPWPRHPAHDARTRGRSHRVTRHFAFGSNSEVELADADFRFTPESGHPVGGLGCPLCAMNGRKARPYSIISSARPSSEFGTVIPKVLAVFRLMISIVFVDCCTGRSAGFSPLRIRPA